MPVTVDSETFFRTTEACQMAGISRATLFRWLSEGIVVDTMRKDRKGWRLFSEQDITRIKAEANRIY
jgi:DNA-binding transcriptional MerR regulator